MEAMLAESMTMEEFQDTIKKDTVLEQNNPSDQELVDGYIEARNKTMAALATAGVEVSAARAAFEKLAFAFLRRWLGRKWARLDGGFLATKWQFYVHRDQRGNVTASTKAPDEVQPGLDFLADIPRFFSSSIDVDEFIDRGVAGRFGHEAMETVVVGRFAAYRRKGVSLRGASVNARALVPAGIGSSQKTKAMALLADFYRAAAACLETGVDLFRQADLLSRDYPGAIRVIWAPNLDDLSLTTELIKPRGDPAIVWDFGDTFWLLDFYDTPDERPIENIVREYSDGPLPKRS